MQCWVGQAWPAVAQANPGKVWPVVVATVVRVSLLAHIGICRQWTSKGQPLCDMEASEVTVGNAVRDPPGIISPLRRGISQTTAAADWTPGELQGMARPLGDRDELSRRTALSYPVGIHY